MARVYPLFSSSNGNSFFLGSSDSGILIDCGVSFTRLKNALGLNGIGTDAVKAVFITHEHSDHIAGLKMLTKKLSVPVYSKSVTLDYLYDNGHILSEARDIGSGAEIDGFSVTSFETSHDARQPCGFTVIYPDGKKFSLCTDTGFISFDISDAVKGSEAVVLEANYDEEMLFKGNYPVELKRRIRSEYGHLSNVQSGQFAAELIESGTTRLILAHLSQENNTPDAAMDTVRDIVTGSGFTSNKDYLLSCAPRETSGGFISF